MQTILFAWAFGALLEGLVGFGYPWAVVAPILISLGISDLNAIRVAAIANNAPVSYGALGAPIIALAAVTGYPLLALSGSVGTIVAILALLPPWVLLYLVSGKEGMKGGWPLAVVGSLGYIAGQYPVAVYWGPYLPDVAGAIVCFAALLVLLKVWQPKTVLGYGGVPVDAATARQTQSHGLGSGEVLQAWLPFAVLLVVVAAWTGPWSTLPKVSWFKAQAVACSALAATCTAAKPIVTAVFNFAPYIGGTAILASWIIVVVLLIAMGRVEGRPARRGVPAQLPPDVGRVPGRRLHLRARLHVQLLGHGGLARQGLLDHRHRPSSSSARSSASSAWRCRARTPRPTPCSASSRRWWARSSACRRCCCRRFNSVGAEIGKPVAPQTASVGVSTSKFVRKEGDVIRHNMGWTFILLAYLIVIAIAFYLVKPAVMTLPASGG